MCDCVYLLLVTCFIDCHLFLLFLTCLYYVFYIFFSYPYGLLSEIKYLFIIIDIDIISLYIPSTRLRLHLHNIHLHLRLPSTRFPAKHGTLSSYQHKIVVICVMVLILSTQNSCHLCDGSYPINTK